jgi:hypothetical protein
MPVARTLSLDELNEAVRMPNIDLQNVDNIVLVMLIYGGVVLIAFWLAMVLWAFRDMRARSRDRLAQLQVAALVAVLTLPGLFIYLLLRPRETLAESYERSLEEEALLQEIEDKPNCPGCGQRTQTNWQVCPNCHTKLKKPCVACGKTLELAWNICPYCATGQPTYATDPIGIDLNPSYADTSMAVARPSRRRSVTRDPVSRGSASQVSQQTGSTDSLEFVDSEDYR